MNRRWTVSQLLARPLPVAIRGSGRRQGLGCTPLGQLVELEELEEIAADLKPTELFDLFNVAKNARQQIVSNGQNPEMYSATWIGNKCAGVEHPTTWKVDSSTKDVVGLAVCCPSSESNPREPTDGCVSKEIARYPAPTK